MRISPTLPLRRCAYWPSWVNVKSMETLRLVPEETTKQLVLFDTLVGSNSSVSVHEPGELDEALQVRVDNLGSVQKATFDSQTKLQSEWTAQVKKILPSSMEGTNVLK